MWQFLKNLFGLDTDQEAQEALIDANVCPNCWGSQEYAGQFKAYAKDRTRSNITKDPEGRKAFIQQFVEDHVTGIKLINDGAQKTCPSCRAKYKP